MLFGRPTPLGRVDAHRRVSVSTEVHGALGLRDEGGDRSLLLVHRGRLLVHRGGLERNERRVRGLPEYIAKFRTDLLDWRALDGRRSIISTEADG